MEGLKKIVLKKVKVEWPYLFSCDILTRIQWWQQAWVGTSGGDSTV